MHFSIFLHVIGLLVNTINVPFDRGANLQGSKRAPEVINKHLNFLNINQNFTVVSKNNHIAKNFSKIHGKVSFSKHVKKKKKRPQSAPAKRVETRANNEKKYLLMNRNQKRTKNANSRIHIEMKYKWPIRLCNDKEIRQWKPFFEKE